MRLLLTSDTHLGITTDGQLKVILKQAAEEQFDVLVHAGDYSGGLEGYKRVKETVELIRDYFPDKPYVTVIGNHDYWMKGKRSAKPNTEDFNKNITNIKQIFKQNKVHFLDEDGLYIHPNFPEIVLVGCSGWYNHHNPPTNDKNYLPIGLEGDTHHYLLREANNRLYRNLDALDSHLLASDLSPTIVFISHFGVLKDFNDYKGSFDEFCWNGHIGYLMQEHYKCKYILNGHSHQFHNGPIKYECGSDYYNPRYLIINIT